MDELSAEAARNLARGPDAGICGLLIAGTTFHCMRDYGHGGDHEFVDLAGGTSAPKPDIRKRNKRNRQRGHAFERTVAREYGGRRTGPLQGRDDVMVGDVFAIQTKRTLRLSLNEARKYLRDLRSAFPKHVPVVIHALPGERGGVVIWDKRDHVAMHGQDAMAQVQPVDPYPASLLEER